MIRGRAEKRTDPAVVASDAAFGSIPADFIIGLADLKGVNEVRASAITVVKPRGEAPASILCGLTAGIHPSYGPLYLRDIIGRIEREEEVYSPFRTVNS